MIYVRDNGVGFDMKATPTSCSGFSGAMHGTEDFWKAPAWVGHGGPGSSANTAANLAELAGAGRNFYFTLGGGQPEAPGGLVNCLKFAGLAREAGKLPSAPLLVWPVPENIIFHEHNA